MSPCSVRGLGERELKKLGGSLVSRRFVSGESVSFRLHRSVWAWTMPSWLMMVTGKIISSAISECGKKLGD